MNKNNPFSDFKDELGDVVVETVKTVKKQITVKPPPQTDQNGQIMPEAQPDPKINKKIDPTTGKPIPSQKMLTQLTQQTAQLAQMRLKKVREELEKQRLKMGNEQSAMGNTDQVGPEIKIGDKKPKDDAVQKALQSSKSTGEFKGAAGG